MFLFSVPFFFGPLKLRGSRCAELFQGKRLQILLEKNIAKRRKYLFLWEAATQPSEWPANFPREKIHLFCFYRVARKKTSTFTKTGWVSGM